MMMPTAGGLLEKEVSAAMVLFVHEIPPLV